jgi:menaquinone-specific isochorismate synthase
MAIVGTDLELFRGLSTYLPGRTPWDCLMANRGETIGKPVVIWELGRETLVGVGAIGAIEASGPRRFEEVRERLSSFMAHCSLGGPQNEVPGCLFAMGGFSFASGRTGWPGFKESLFYLPERTYCRRSGLDTIESQWTVTDADRAARATGYPPARLELTRNGSPTPDLTEDMGRAQWMDLVRATLDRIRQGVFSKAVLARSVTVPLPPGRSSLDIFETLRDAYPDCFRFLLDDGQGNAFLGASPERLVSSIHGMIHTEAVAGTMRCEPGDDSDAIARRLLDSKKDRAEHDAVLRHLREVLEPICYKIDMYETEVMRLPHLLHLRTRIRGFNKPRTDVLDLVAGLHPTPAVAGWPRTEALDWIAHMESEDRGWYAGPIGQLDFSGKGDFAVGIRSIAIRGDKARVFAGAGIVEGSDPEQEWNETEIKMRGMLDAIARD